MQKLHREKNGIKVIIVRFFWGKYIIKEQRNVVGNNVTNEQIVMYGG
jgi:hypothetical protein